MIVVSPLQSEVVPRAYGVSKEQGCDDSRWQVIWNVEEGTRFWQERQIRWWKVQLLQHEKN